MISLVRRTLTTGVALVCLSACAHSEKKETGAGERAESATQSKTTNGFDAELTQYAYPFPVATLELKSQGQDLKMRYMDIAPEGAAKGTVLLLHGKNFSGAYWKETIDILRKDGFRIVAPDQIGFGKSSKPRGYQYSVMQLADNTEALLRELKVGPVHVVGHSMGGMIATRLVLMHPERSLSLSLINPIGLEDWKTRVPYKTIDAIYEQELKATPESIKGYQQQTYFAGHWQPSYDSLLTIANGWLAGPDYPLIAWTSAQTTEMLLSQPVVYEFGRIKAPTLLVIGTRDRTALGKAWAAPDVQKTLGNYEQLGKTAAKAIPKAKLVELPGIGHMPQVEAFPAYSQALLSFLHDSSRRGR